MKVLLLNGSPRKESNTLLALKEVQGELEKSGIETELITVGNRAVRGCIACGGCAKGGGCVLDDDVNRIAAKLKEADGLVVGSPVYYAAANSTLTALLDRLFYSCPFDLTMKVGAAVVCARRGGNTAAFDQLNKYFTIAGMPVASSQYWNMVHGRAPGESAEDGEGMQTMRTLGRNMAFLIRSIALGKQAYGLPQKEERVSTHFIRP